ncbi:MAG TPA: RagB/SusD family nutrient uptake outer membrane protein [Chitinophagaceae bacterium]|nr:RagB/SusD family nutrient uptake outer membrane protein [Chitinophagaceae bacterium]
MKQAYIFLCLLISSALVVSCSKQLEQAPVSTASRDVVFGSEQGLALYSNSFYEGLPAGTDIYEGDNIVDYGARTQVPDLLRPGAYGARQSSGWDWRQLRNINYFIANAKDPRVSATVNTNYVAIGRFFRAWFYYEKVKRFGDVPWMGATIDVSDTSTLYKARDPRTLVMDSVLADLDFAIKNITLTDDKTRSLITKNIALAFKSRVCLFEGSFRRYHTELNLQSTAAKWFTEAATAAQTVVSSNAFSLNTAPGTVGAYRALFITQGAPVANEVMLSYIYSKDLAVLNDATWWWTSATYGSRLSFTRTFINTFLKNDGTPFTNTPGYQTMLFPDEVKGRDGRLQQLIRMGDYKRINGGVPVAAPPVFSYTYTGYQPIKWTLDDAYYEQGVTGDNPIPIIRYAEVLLNLAEAKAELGTLTDADWAKTIGALRQRAGITGGLSTKPTVLDPYMVNNYFPEVTDPSIMEIRRERGIELAFENLRFPDLLRWKKGKLLEQVWNGIFVPALNTPMDLNADGKMDVVFYKTMPGTTLPGVTYVNVSETVGGAPNPQRLSNDTYGELTWLTNVPRVWDDKMYYYPIPETDRLFNPKLGQNPGW